MRKNPRIAVLDVMRKQGLTQGALAARLGIHQGNLSRILRGLQDPSEETKAAFERELEVPRDLWGRLRKDSLRALERATRAAKRVAA
jgi:transcriptional regulator with XRE-family HTH domain